MPKKILKYRVPENKEEADLLISIIGEKQREIDEIQNKLNADIEALKKAVEPSIRSREEIVSQHLQNLFVYAEKNRKELTQSGKIKTVKLLHGTFAWRKTRPKVNISVAKEMVIANLKALGLIQFIKITEDIDKTALLKESEITKGIPDISITQSEEFVVKPDEVKVRIARDVIDLKRTVSEEAQ